ncbi:hypothetical protein ACS0TY_018485 [Phlomoides rotata]
MEWRTMVMLGVDRLDMIKGIRPKILAFENFLEQNPEWRDKVVLLQIAVSTRTDVPEYKKLTGQVHEVVGRINGRFGTLTSVPVHHLDRSLEFHALCALYAVTDIALVTSLRDGMNLVSYEFVACRGSKKVFRSSTVSWCWSNSCKSLEHHRVNCCNMSSFKYAC